MNNRLPLIAAGAVVVLAGGYFGLGSYASKQAQKHVEDWVYDTGLDDKLSWGAISSSPLGGRISLTDVELSLGSKEPGLRVAELIISERISDDSQTRVRVQLKGVEADATALSGLQSLGGMAAGSFGRGFSQASHGFQPALNSGLVTLKPFDAELFFNVDDSAGILETDVAVALPELFDSHISYRISNQRDLNRGLQRLGDDFDAQSNLFAALGKLEALGKSLDRAEVANIEFSLQDRGMVERSIALYQRYNTPLDPTAGSADKQRKAHYQQVVDNAVKGCERDNRDLPESLDNSCELLEKIMLGKVDGVELSIKPKDSVRLSDLALVQDPRLGKRVLDRLNPKLSSL